jgi:GDP-L-fucose synthase
MKTSDKIFIAGHNGMVGKAVVAECLNRGYSHILNAAHQDLDLTDQSATNAYFSQQQPDIVVLAAAKVGGIAANDRYPAEFIRINLAIQSNVIHAAWENGCRRLLFLGTGCIYPRDAANPIHESALLTGSLEPTNQWYAIAKIAGIKMCEAYTKQYGFSTISAMPCNLYGPNDYFDLEKAHVLPALLRKFHEAKTAGDKTVEVWGSGRPTREFLHVDDAADACLTLLEDDGVTGLVNVGFGQSLTIAELARLIAEVTGFEGEISYDLSRPDGTPEKLLDSQRMRDVGWRPKIGLRDGIAQTYQWYLDNIEQARGLS